MVIKPLLLIHQDDISKGTTHINSDSHFILPLKIASYAYNINHEGIDTIDK